ncbi:hypothetical protein GCM10011390_42020 [Aureimonas endophytica]|uniref:Uncharacterized protein n=1 Tax=Aureimonas endophytica TaxID=2027858 RepID=A0A916ZZS4_9HYPH|nr:hypothetical protein [Aureimonas endophytica]GGE18432.1 hypothetical protein GCM10011390_42020 [Aureimonas endophytica]
MSAPLDGGAAFPVIPPQDENGIGSASGYPFPESGMSLRDWFAGQAMASRIIALGDHAHSSDKARLACKAETASRAYEMADAMLAARSSKQEER